MKKNNKQLLSSDALMFKRFKIAEIISIVIASIGFIIGAIFGALYANNPGYLGIELSKNLLIIGLVITIIGLIAFIYFYFKIYKILKNN